MDSESKTSVTEETFTVAAPAGAPAPAAKAAPASVPHRLDEVLKQVKAELLSGHERRRGANPYDSQLGRPNRDVWGTRKRA